MKDLPVELCHTVVESVSSTSDVLSLRSTNSTFHRLVTAHVFRKIHVQNSVQSARNCQSILTSPSLAVHVREVVYDQRDLSHAHFRLPPSGTQDTCKGMELEELEEALTNTFWELQCFVNLEHVVLNFWPSFRCHHGLYIQENPFWFTNRQITILRGVYQSMKSVSIRSLTLNNVLLIPLGDYDFASSAKNSPLHHLSISVVTNSELTAWTGSQAVNGSLGSLLPFSNANLKSLVLRSPRGLYHSSNSHLEFSIYPALEELIIENFVFDPIPYAGGIEDFIVCHKGSLRRLELRGCSSYVPNVTTPVRKWTIIWKRLEEELGSSTKLVIGDLNLAYTLFAGDHGYVPHPSPPADLGQE